MPLIDTSSFSQDFNIIGVVSLFGGEIALSALRYTILVRDKWKSVYFSIVVSAGLQTVAIKMFKRMDDRVSVAISPGIRDDSKDMVGLGASMQYNYFGIHSGTDMCVENILGESVIRGPLRGTKTFVKCTRQGENPKRNTKLKVIQLGQLQNVDGQLIHADDASFGIVYLMPLITLVGIVMTVLIGDYHALVIVVVNVLCNMLVVLSVRASGIKYPEGKASSGSPIGHIYVNCPDGACVILGKEDAIQYLFQKQLIVPPDSKDKWRHIQKFVAYLSYIIVIVNIIVVPFAFPSGQLIFGILMLCGLFQNILLAMHDGDRLLRKVAEKACEIVRSDEYIFLTRSSMIAFCALIARSPNENFLRRTLPNTEIFATWFQSVTECVKNTPPPDSEPEKKDTTLLDNLNADLRDAHREYLEYVKRSDNILKI